MIPCLEDWSTLHFYLYYGGKRQVGVIVEPDEAEPNGYKVINAWVSLIEEEDRLKLKEIRKEVRHEQSKGRRTQETHQETA